MVFFWSIFQFPMFIFESNHFVEKRKQQKCINFFLMKWADQIDKMKVDVLTKVN